MLLACSVFTHIREKAPKLDTVFKERHARRTGDIANGTDGAVNYSHMFVFVL